MGDQTQFCMPRVREKKMQSPLDRNSTAWSRLELYARNETWNCEIACNWEARAI